MKARNQNPEKHRMGQNMEWKLLSLGALWRRDIIREMNNLYFSSSWYTGKDKMVLKSNRENLLHLWGEALDSEAGEVIGKVVRGSCVMSTLDSPGDEITETSVRQQQWQPARRGNRRWNSILGGLRGILLLGGNVLTSRRFRDVVGNDRKSLVLSLIWIAKWRCSVACDHLFA